MKKQYQPALQKFKDKQLANFDIFHDPSSHIKEEIHEEFSSLDSHSKYDSTTAEQVSRRSKLNGNLKMKRSVPINEQVDTKATTELQKLQTVVKRLASPKETVTQRALHPQKSITNSDLLSKRHQLPMPQLQSPRVLSPKDQMDVISFLKQQNQNLKEENKRKDNLIGKLLETCYTKNVPKQPQPQLKQIISPPRTVESKPEQQPTRLPQITTPQPNLKHRIDTQATENLEFQVNKVYQQPITGNAQFFRVQNEQNWSFGKQEEQSSVQTKSQFFVKKPVDDNQSNLSHQKLIQKSARNNFVKPLQKLPMEFQILKWHKQC